jgi:transposase
MSRMVRARYTLEYKQEAVRLVRGGQPIGAVARGLGISDQTVHNWVKADAERDIQKKHRGAMAACGDRNCCAMLAAGRERPSTFWWRVTP